MESDCDSDPEDEALRSLVDGMIEYMWTPGSTQTGHCNGLTSLDCQKLLPHAPVEWAFERPVKSFSPIPEESDTVTDTAAETELSFEEDVFVEYELRILEEIYEGLTVEITLECEQHD